MNENDSAVWEPKKAGDLRRSQISLISHEALQQAWHHGFETSMARRSYTN